MTRFKRADVEQYGSTDLAAMTPEEISEAMDAGHFAEMLNGGDPDAKVTHLPGCSKPEGFELERVPVKGSIRAGDPIHYRCPVCGGSNEPKEQ